ncbi:MAG: hypothetical protein RR860_08890, partial [Janthinobacterium sp.]
RDMKMKADRGCSLLCEGFCEWSIIWSFLGVNTNFWYARHFTLAADHCACPRFGFLALMKHKVASGSCGVVGFSS